MNPEEHEAIQAVIKRATLESLDEGMLTAVLMMRMAAGRRPDLSVTEVADMIESSVTERRQEVEA